MQESMHMLLYRAFHAQRNILLPYMRALGLGAGQPKLIAYLAAHGPCRQQELADYFEIDRAAISRMAESLQKGGFIAISADESNRRRNLLTVTDRGLKAAEAWMAKRAQVEEIMLRGFSPEEREAFSAYLTRALKNYVDWREEHPCEI